MSELQNITAAILAVGQAHAAGDQIIYYGPEQDYSAVEGARASQAVKPFS